MTRFKKWYTAIMTPAILGLLLAALMLHLYLAGRNSVEDPLPPSPTQTPDLITQLETKTEQFDCWKMNETARAEIPGGVLLLKQNRIVHSTDEKVIGYMLEHFDDPTFIRFCVN